MFRKGIAPVVILLFIGMIISSSNGYVEENETFGCYPGLIIGQICNVDISSSKITFYAISVNIFPGHHHLVQRDARLDRPYIGILTSKFICVLGIVYSGW